MFFEDISQTQVIWMLRNAVGWANWSNDGQSILPVWSSEEMAKDSAEPLFRGYTSEAVRLDSFVQNVLPELQTRNLWIGINLFRDMTGIDLSVTEMVQEINKNSPTA